MVLDHCQSLIVARSVLLVQCRSWRLLDFDIDTLDASLNLLSKHSPVQQWLLLAVSNSLVLIRLESALEAKQRFVKMPLPFQTFAFGKQDRRSLLHLLAALILLYDSQSFFTVFEGLVLLSRSQERFSQVHH